ncbi:LexA family transcriptional regulator [uncultured Dubosiella sp.]|uniref:LexA family protein n=1 Tax=uncultured Dubosiella sp. TaxID=1937011 RepID=UPI002597232E|nr:XRE family transcriptional regulator [uncultured Dubosiella sp.]
MAKMCERIVEAMTEKGISQAELSRRTGISKGALSSYINGRYEPKQKNIFKIAAVLNVSEGWLLGGEEKNKSFSLDEAKNLVPFEIKEIPILGKIACGKPIFADEECGRYATISGVNADFALEAQGDSMTGDHIYEGNVVFCKNQPQVENGQIAVVIIDDQATLKHFYYYPERGMVILRASNPKYEDLIYTDEEMADIRILGRAVATEISL